MLFSCLVDADRVDFEGSSALGYIAIPACNVPQYAGQSRSRKSFRAALRPRFQRKSLTLTVRTGGGKTLASVAMALRRAIVQPEKVRRIIVAIPYLVCSFCQRH
jgi:hypothetical protein